MLRNRLGEDVTGTNVLHEGMRLPPARAGGRLSVDFIMDLPFLHQGFYYFSPAGFPCGVYEKGRNGLGGKSCAGGGVGRGPAPMDLRTFPRPRALSGLRDCPRNRAA